MKEVEGRKFKERKEGSGGEFLFLCRRCDRLMIDTCMECQDRIR